MVSAILVNIISGVLTWIICEGITALWREKR